MNNKVCVVTGGTSGSRFSIKKLLNEAKHYTNIFS